MKKHLIILKTFSRMWIVACLICAVVSCHTSKSSSGLITIDVEKAYNEPMRDLMMSEVVEEIEYVKLETNEDCLLGPFATPDDYSENFIVISQMNPKRVLLFSRQGRYIRDIGSFGKGPGEYSNPPFGVRISRDEKLISFHAYPNEILLFRIDGSFINKVRTSAEVNQFAQLNSNEFFTYSTKFSLPPSGGYQFHIYDKELNPVDSLMFSKWDSTYLDSRDRDVIHPCDKGLFLKQKQNDTIFLIGKDRSITPHIILNMGNMQTPLKSIPREDQSKYLHVQFFSDLNSYYLISFMGHPRDPSILGSEYLLYNIASEEAFFINSHTFKLNGDLKTSPQPRNDLDGVMVPKLYQARNHLWAECIDVFEAKEYLEDEDFDPKILVTDNYYKKLQQIVNESSVDDNPIVRILHLKK